MDSYNRDSLVGSSSQFGEQSTEVPNVEERLKSDMFKKHYTKVFDSNNQPVNAKCNYCPGNKLYSFKKGSGYGTLTRHLKEKHPNEVGVPTNQSQLSGFAPSNTPLFRYSDEKNRSELAKMIAVEHLSFSFGEKVGFTNYCQNALNPQAKRMPRTTITRELKKIYKSEKLILTQNFIKLNSRVSICADIWSDLWQMHFYIGVTCHWIDSEWKLQKRVIALRIFETRHTAANIFRMLNIILDEYGLTKKKFSIGFDNASANTASIVHLKNLCQPVIGGKIFHVRCACHILNLAVQDGLEKLKNFIKPIKDALNALWTRPTLMRQWTKFCIENGKKPRRFTKDVPNRWNSTYALLHSSARYSNLLCTFFMQYQIESVNLHPTMWDICSKMLDILKIFKDATEILSGVYYPTSHLFIHITCDIIGILHQYKDDPELSPSIYDILKKWLVYYEYIPPTYLLASLFDPRQKLDILEKYLYAYYDCINDFYDGVESYTRVNVHEIISNLKLIAHETFIEFHSIYSEQVPTSTGSMSTGSVNIGGSTSTNIGFSETHYSSTSSSLAPRKLGKSVYTSHKKPRAGTETELEMYLTTTFEVRDDDSDFHEWPVLEWWKGKEKDYPILSIIAKHILAVPASTVAVEQAFSAGGSILDEQRSRLLPQTLEVQALVADWHKAALRAQEMEKKDDMDLDYDTDMSDISTISTAGSSTGTGTGHNTETFEDSDN